MNVDRLSITMEPKLGAAARKAAKRAGISVSAWIAEATADRIRNDALGRALDEWEAEDGAFTADELATAASELGLSPPAATQSGTAPMKVILDAGAFVAVEKRDRRIGAMLRLLQQRRMPVRTSSAVVAQVWRDGRKQVELARLLAGVDVRPLAPDEDKRTGELLARVRTNDVVDGHVALLADNGDLVITSDRDDLERLIAARTVDVVFVDV